jgi:hypothetical protein
MPLTAAQKMKREVSMNFGACEWLERRYPWSEPSAGTLRSASLWLAQLDSGELKLALDEIDVRAQELDQIGDGCPAVALCCSRGLISRLLKVRK